MSQENIYQHLDFRRFLRAALVARKEARRPVSLANLGKRCGGVSKAQLSLVLSGKRTLSGPLAEKLSQALGLSGPERKYFQHLVAFNQAENGTDREIHFESLIDLRPKQASQELDEQQYLALRNWHCLVLRELVRLPAFNPDPRELSRRLKGKFKPQEAKLAMETLLKLGLVKNLDGKYISTERNITTSDDVQSLLIQSYHRSCLELGKTVLEIVPVEAREFSSTNLVLTEEEFKSLRSQLKGFRNKALKTESPAHPERKKKVYQLNVQLFEMAE